MFCHQNVQCLSNKVLILDVALEESKSDFLLLSEHWLNIDQLFQIRLSNFLLVSAFCRSILKHGGVAIFRSIDYKK